jgi:hypothetical protein
VVDAQALPCLVILSSTPDRNEPILVRRLPHPDLQTRRSATPTQPKINDLVLSRVSDHKPADTLLGVQTLAEPGYLIEVEAIAVVD